MEEKRRNEWHLSAQVDYHNDHPPPSWQEFYKANYEIGEMVDEEDYQAYLDGYRYFNVEV